MKGFRRGPIKSKYQQFVQNGLPAGRDTQVREGYIAAVRQCPGQGSQPAASE